jgi:hypothetical protein
MSAAWDTAKVITENETRQKRAIRLWGYLAVGGLFLLYLVHALGVKFIAL